MALAVLTRKRSRSTTRPPHMPLVANMSGFTRTDKARVEGARDGGKPAFYRIFEFWFENADAMKKTMGSPEGKAAVGDFQSSRRVAFTVLVSAVE